MSPFCENLWRNYIDGLETNQKGIFNTIGQHKLFRDLFAWRENKSSELNVDPVTLLTDHSLAFVCRAMPATQVGQSSILNSENKLSKHEKQSLLNIIERHREWMNSVENN